MALDKARLKPGEEYKAAIKLQVEKFNKDREAAKSQFHSDNQAAQTNFHADNKQQQENFRTGKEAEKDNFKEGNQEAQNNFHEKADQAQDKFHSDKEESENRFNENVDQQGLSKIPDAKTAEREASKQGSSISGILKENQKGNKNKGSSNFGLKNEALGDASKYHEKFGKENGITFGTMKKLWKSAKEEKEKGKLAKIKDELVDLGAQAFSAGTSELLELSWENAIETFGATLIYTNFHVFCRFVFGEKFFCKLGHEWTLGKGGSATKAAGKAESSASKGKPGGKGIDTIFGFALDGVGLFEAAILGIIDFLIIIIVLICLMPFIIIGLIVADPSGSFKFLWDNLSAFYDAFKSLVL